MNRVLESEVMDEVEQVAAYANAASRGNVKFLRLLLDAIPNDFSGHIVDVGCGPGFETIRIAEAFPKCLITGIDVSQEMLKHANLALQKTKLNSRVDFVCGKFQNFSLPDGDVCVVSNYVLHHLHNPCEFWSWLLEKIPKGSIFFVMDLLRPVSFDAAMDLLKKHANLEPEVLQRDFLHSMLAGFTINEIQKQIKLAAFHSSYISAPDSRHWVVKGIT